MDYGPVGEIKDGVNRYQFWDYSRNNGSPLLFLLPEQVLGLSLLSVTSNTGPMLNWQWTSGSVQIKGHVYLHYSR